MDDNVLITTISYRGIHIEKRMFVEESEFPQGEIPLQDKLDYLAVKAQFAISRDLDNGKGD